MTANNTDATPPDNPGGKDSSRDSELQTDSRTSRRHFLAGLLALGLIPTAVDGAGARVDRDRVDVTHGEYGPHRARIESGGPLNGSLELGEFHEETSEISVSATHFDDQEPNHVEVKVSVGPAWVFLSCSPGRARELAEEFRTAAEFAESGER